MFSKAIVRTPCPAIVNGLTTANLGKPDYLLALVQHRKYIAALEECGLDVLVLEPDNRFPDSTFIEDVAVLIPECAIITNPGAPSRKGEIDGMEAILRQFYHRVEFIREPGTLEGGDVMKVGSHFYVGLSSRTNEAGVRQFRQIVSQYGMSVSTVELNQVLHLKSAVSYLTEDTLVISREFAGNPAFANFRHIPIARKESYAANCVWINGKVLVPEEFPKAKKAIENTGYSCRAVAVSEFRKLDGGLSCLSLRF